MRRIIALLTIPIMLGGGAILWGLAGARADPVVRRATIVLPDWPAEAPAAHVVLISDIHIGTIAMGAGRLTRIVGQVNALKPDLVLIAGDFIYGHERDGAARFSDPMIAPLAMLRARLGVVAVLATTITGRDRRRCATSWRAQKSRSSTIRRSSGGPW